VSKKSQKVYMCCTATKSVIYYTKPHKNKLWEITNLKENTMFTFEEQYKKFEELNERTKQAYEFWVKAVMSTFEDIYKPKKK
jgi:hypothetical protein